MVRQGTCRLYHRNRDDVDVEKYRELKEKYNKLLEEYQRMISRIEYMEISRERLIVRKKIM